MVDVQGDIVDLISGTAGIEAWRNRLPVGFSNNKKTAFVVVFDDRHHNSGATRSVVVEVRVFGGSAKVADLRAACERIVQTLIALRTANISRIGEINVQELPPEPETGWVSAIIRFSATIKER